MSIFFLSISNLLSRLPVSDLSPDTLEGDGIRKEPQRGNIDWFILSLSTVQKRGSKAGDGVGWLTKWARGGEASRSPQMTMSSFAGILLLEEARTFAQHAPLRDVHD